MTTSLDLAQFGLDRFSNRELSRLEFGSRLLDLADDQNLPILERCKFAAIFAEMFDEFFQVRVVSLEDKIAAGVDTPSVDGLRPKEQWRMVRNRAVALTERLEQLVQDSLWPELARAGIAIIRFHETTETERDYLRTYFEQHIFPVLTPLSVDPGHPFPMISNLSLNIAATVRDPESGAERAARVKVPNQVDRFVALPGHDRFVLVEDVIVANLGSLFPGMEICQADIFRVTRNADLALEEDEADDLLVALEVELRRRRFGKAIRLETQRQMDREFLDLLIDQLELDYDHTYVTSAPLGLGSLWQLYGLDRPDLKNSTWSPLTPARLGNGSSIGDVFEVISQGDVVVHHPYESFSDSVEAFIDQAADDPSVLAIKQTLYRTSGDSPIVEALIRAAGSGKQVAALVELQARFDEAANIKWARRLEDAGVHVVYGIVGFKTHSKIALVLRREGDGLRRYAHVGTGNYNPKTARNYEDLSLLTCDESITADVASLFNYLTGFAKHTEYQSIVVSPISVRSRIVSLIHREAAKGPEGRITIKVNGLTDPVVIDALYRASQAGAMVRLVVRTLCCLRPGVPGLSENISVKSVVGEFLEHSRIFRFGQGPEADLFIGSADMMERNLDRRIEVLVPLNDARCRDRVEEALELTLRDDMWSWSLGTDRRWRRVASLDAVSVQDQLKARATRRNWQSAEEDASDVSSPN
jgi:polyphosphate kinase